MKYFFLMPLVLFLMSQVSFAGESDNSGFYIKRIDNGIFSRMQGKSYPSDCNLPLEDLRYIHVLHKDSNGRTHEGEIICNTYIASDILDIFMKLYEADYPIERMRLIDDYDNIDELSMRDNNTSSFGFSFISDTKISKHAFGLALDINPLYNPYIAEVNGEKILQPEIAGAYVDRTKNFPYKINKNDLCYTLFIEHGFEWGGDWNSLKDYQHFETPDEITKILYPEFKEHFDRHPKSDFKK